MPTITLIVDDLSGAVLLEGPDRHAPDVLAGLAAVFGPARELGCARPLAVLPPPDTPAGEGIGPCVRVAGYYHDSLVEGPGRRSSALLSGCDLGCLGCWVPHLHDPLGGQSVPAKYLAAALLDPAYQRDGVSLLGGEPFRQPEGLLALVQALRDRGCPHILVYSGHTYERLRRRARHQPAIDAILDTIDMLVDGPYVEALADGAGPWTGSGNQRVLALTGGRPTPWAEA